MAGELDPRAAREPEVAALAHDAAAQLARVDADRVAGAVLGGVVGLVARLDIDAQGARHQGQDHAQELGWGPALPTWQKKRNRLIAPIRAEVETIFAILKRRMAYRGVHYIGLVKNAAYLLLLAIAYNMRRAADIAAPRLQSVRT